MENHVASPDQSSAAAMPPPPSEAEKIPKELETVLPSDPFELLRISRALALQACAVRIQSLQNENQELHTSSDASMRELQGKVASLQLSLTEAEEKLTKKQEEQEKMAEEKAALVAMVKKLNRDVAKLETFKRTLMSQLQDDGGEDEGPVGKGPAASAEVSSASNAVGALRLTQSLRKTNLSTDGGESSDNSENRPPRPSLSVKTSSLRTPSSMTPSIFSPAYTPSATPPHSSNAASPRVGGKSGRPRVDGKEFFRQARSRLSYEQFSTFLGNIKELNAHKQSREDTLKKAAEIFGDDNKDLYTQFENLLSRHLPS